LTVAGERPSRSAICRIEALELAGMPRQGDRPSTLDNPTHSRG
jgi:hypothetical protein